MTINRVFKWNWIRRPPRSSDIEILGVISDAEEMLGGVNDIREVFIDFSEVSVLNISEIKYFMYF